MQAYIIKNTEKVVKAIAEKHLEIELIDATKTVLKDLASYDLIGFASGIFHGKFYYSGSKSQKKSR